jgi:hypothetical protein
MKMVMSKRPVDEGQIARDTWKKFLNPQGWKKRGKLVEYVGLRKWHKVAAPADANSIIGWETVPSVGISAGLSGVGRIRRV